MRDERQKVSAGFFLRALDQKAMFGGRYDVK